MRFILYRLASPLAVTVLLAVGVGAGNCLAQDFGCAEFSLPRDVFSFETGNMIPDEVLDQQDVEAFALGLTDPIAYLFLVGGEPVEFGDMNFDNSFDFDDIQPFVDYICPPVIPEPSGGSLALVGLLVSVIRKRGGRQHVSS